MGDTVVAVSDKWAEFATFDRAVVVTAGVVAEELRQGGSEGLP
jgi:hypothetical protein